MSVVKFFSFQPLDFIKEIGIIQTFVFNYFSFFQPNVYNSRQIKSIDIFGTQIPVSFCLLLFPNEVVVLAYEKYTLFWFWFHLYTGFSKVRSIEYSRLSLADVRSHNTLQISNNFLDGEVLNPYIYNTRRNSNKILALQNLLEEIEIRETLKHRIGELRSETRPSTVLYS